MEASTLNQIIETAGLLLVVLITGGFYLWVHRIKKTLRSEENYLKDILILRGIIWMYQERLRDEDKATEYGKFKGAIEKELEFDLTQNSEPARVRRRLKLLKDYNGRVDALANKILPLQS